MELSSQTTEQSLFQTSLHGLPNPAKDRYNAIMERHNGDPSGIEFNHKRGDRWAFVLPDASDPGRYRYQSFDEHGFISHATFNTVSEAVRDMVESGYVNEDIGALDRMSQTATWAEGVETIELLRRLNGGDITFPQYLQERKLIAERYAQQSVKVA